MKPYLKVVAIRPTSVRASRGTVWVVGCVLLASACAAPESTSTDTGNQAPDDVVATSDAGNQAPDDVVATSDTGNQAPDDVVATSDTGNQTPDDVAATFDMGTSSAEPNGLVRRGFPPLPECSPPAAQFNIMNDATYQIFAEVESIDPDTDQVVKQAIFIGTGWALGERLLATNAHVAGAFADAANAGTQYSRAVAVQAGTGKVVRLLREVTHPSYNGDPLRSPDVALLTTQEALPSALELADADSILDLGDEFYLVGFPGDVETFITQSPGETIPQATSLSGEISARRAHGEEQVVTPDTLAVYQHQAPTSPGTSGSPMMHCGEVIGINNAGTVRHVVVPTGNGEYSVDRQAAAANNFGVHVRFIHEMRELFQSDAIQGNAIPLPAVPVEASAPSGGSGEDDDAETPDSLTFEGEVTDSHSISFDVDLTTGELTGTADWGEGNSFNLAGTVELETLEFSMVDDAPEQSENAPRGFYVGRIYEDGTFDGSYSDDEREGLPFSGALVN